MFAVTEAEAAAIRAAFEQGGEFAAAVELRRLFPGVTDNDEARECARTIAAWKPRSTGRRPGALRETGGTGFSRPETPAFTATRTRCASAGLVTGCH
jgi:hypothetical protein